MKKYSIYFLGLLFFSHLAFGEPLEQAEILLHQGKYQEALELLQPLVEKGDQKACFFTSLALLFGDHPQSDEGLKILQEAANKGYNPALDMLAGLYLHGEFVGQDHAQALRYYEIAARRGYGPSQFNCGILYKNGEKTPKDLESAFVYLSMAALNRGDLDDLTEDAAHYRDEVARQLTPEQYQRALQRINKVVLR